MLMDIDVLFNDVMFRLMIDNKFALKCFCCNWIAILIPGVVLTPNYGF
jgi:hypothetical protein